jgi:hypothetical protein
VQGQAVCVAWWFVRAVAHPHSAHLSEFLSARKTLAVHRH